VKRRIRGRSGGVELDLRDHEAGLLVSLVGQLCAVLGADEQPEGDQGHWERQFRRPGLDDSDPVIRRLFPSAYRDADADAEFRRLSESDALARKLADAEAVLDDLEGGRTVRLSTERAGRWLRTLNALRLSLAVRLGIEDEASIRALDALGEDDPRAFPYGVYDWLGFVMESMLGALSKG
jgi:hypothetical protein